MKKIYYEKQGRKYVPVTEYDNDLLDSLPKGHHLVSVYPGGSSRRYNIDPAYAPLIAASRVAREAMTQAISKASEVKPKRQPMTPAQQEAWHNLIEVWGDDARSLMGSSAYDIAEAGTAALITEVDKLLSNASVRKAYERFLMVAELTKEHNDES